MMEEMADETAASTRTRTTQPGLNDLQWESHDEMHEAIEKYDDQFNEEAGTLTRETIQHLASEGKRLTEPTREPPR